MFCSLRSKHHLKQEIKDVDFTGVRTMGIMALGKLSCNRFHVPLIALICFVRREIHLLHTSDHGIVIKHFITPFFYKLFIIIYLLIIYLLIIIYFYLSIKLL